ncbi:MAG: ureidoglycolate lyase [Roseobacter sp.]
MNQDIQCQPLTAEAFRPFGDVLEATGDPDKLINDGFCGRYHDLARLEFGTEGRAGISMFQAQARQLPYMLTLLERHPEGSQAFVPMTEHPFLVIVAPDVNGKPGQPLAFLTKPHQGINFHKGTWHGVLTPLAKPGLFAVIDRIGISANLEEVLVDPPYRVVA